MKFRKFVKGFDLFGHQIKMRFNGKGDMHQTLLGGLATMCLYFFMLFYTVILFQQMLNNEADKNNTVIFEKSVSTIDKVYLD